MTLPWWTPTPIPHGFWWGGVPRPPFPHGFGLGAGVRGSPLPHTTAMMWYAQIWCDTMWFTVLYFIDIMWKYVKICENIWTFNICENMWKHVKTMSCVNMSSLDLLRTWLICRQYMEVFLFWKSEWAQRILWTFWKRTSALKMNKNTLKIRHLSTVVD